MTVPSSDFDCIRAMSQVPSWKVQRAAINAAIALEVLLSLSSSWWRRERLAFWGLEVISFASNTRKPIH